MKLQQQLNIMSKRAEEAALEAYPIKQSYNDYYGDYEDVNIVERISFQEGYEQAEKDLELTWEDVQLLDLYAMECQVEESNGRKFNSSQEFFEEVLQRFNKTKNE